MTDEQKYDDTPEDLSVQVHPTVYIMGASCGLMDRLISQSNSWAEGDDNICLVDEEALEIPELARALEEYEASGDLLPLSGYDVVVSR